MSKMIDDLIETTVDLIELRTICKQLKADNQELKAKNESLNEAFQQQGTISGLLEDENVGLKVEIEELKRDFNNYPMDKRNSLSVQNGRLQKEVVELKWEVEELNKANIGACDAARKLLDLGTKWEESLRNGIEELTLFCALECDSKEVCVESACRITKALNSLGSLLIDGYKGGKR